MTMLDEQGYLDWKRWTKEGFGQLRKGDAAYFRSECAGLIRRTTVRKVLEIGFGEGSFLGFCKAQGWAVTGVELNQQLVSIAREAGFEAISSDDLARMPGGSFDLIAAFDVAEHIPPDQILPFLAQLKALLSPDGRILLRFPNADSWLGNVNQHGDVTHVMQIGYLKLVYLAQQSGMVIEEFRAERRRGFASGVAHGMHMLVSEPLRRAIGFVLKAIYFPRTPVVLSAANVVAVLRISK